MPAFLIEASYPRLNLTYGALAVWGEDYIAICAYQPTTLVTSPLFLYCSILGICLKVPTYCSSAYRSA
jgi:hypothetical protein